MKNAPDHGHADGRRADARGGRPTKAAAAERDERLLEIAAQMFMRDGFDATSMERLAETAKIGKATLYARYADKSQLFADILRRRILLIYGPLEAEFAEGLGSGSLEQTLLILARRFIDLSLSPSSIALGRILAAEGERFPELGKLAVEEGLNRQLRLVEAVLTRFGAARRYAIGDMALAADLFLSIVLGRISRTALLGVRMEPDTLDRRTREAVRTFVRGITQEVDKSSI
ncbi:TetR/AcrR family transcriptional regulator [Methylocella sp.]|jgi:AcrR family transcriptional regulator|uniref:TetR/AcrR family transcriptional regulator n=1 Tax=Methylocella sp. TaxID=1978226 RepID=UPI003C25B588